jgi:hypothetical protein
MKPCLLILLSTLLASCSTHPVQGDAEGDSLAKPIALERANWERYINAAEQYYQKGRSHLVAIARSLKSKEVHEIRIGDPHLHVQWQAGGEWSLASDDLQQQLIQPLQELAIFAASSTGSEIKLLALPTTHFHPTKEVLATLYFAPMPDRNLCVPAEMARLATGACSLPLDDGWFIDVVW